MMLSKRMVARSKKSTRITVSLADQEHAELTALAERYDVSLSWLTRQAIVEFLEMRSKGSDQLPFELHLQTKREQQ